MSKCQKNKHFIGTCPGPRTVNKEFNQSFANLMSARDMLDSQLKPELQPQLQMKPQLQLQMKPQPQITKKSDIDLILEGE